jgi:hypothetical protein
LIQHIGLRQLGLEVSQTCHNQTRNIRLEKNR